MTPEEIRKLKRRIIDFLHKYATDDQIHQVAKTLNIEPKEREK
jgi:hypothetical protein